MSKPFNLRVMIEEAVVELTKIDKDNIQCPRSKKGYLQKPSQTKHQEFIPSTHNKKIFGGVEIQSVKVSKADHKEKTRDFQSIKV